MAQGILNSSLAPENLQLFASKDLDEIKVGLKFPDEDTAVEAILGWGEKVLFVLLQNQGETRVLLRQGGRKEEGGV